jgi:hypothetical protein
MKKRDRRFCDISDILDPLPAPLRHKVSQTQDSQMKNGSPPLAFSFLSSLGVTNLYSSDHSLLQSEKNCLSNSFLVTNSKWNRNDHKRGHYDKQQQTIVLQGISPIIYEFIRKQEL